MGHKAEAKRGKVSIRGLLSSAFSLVVTSLSSIISIFDKRKGHFLKVSNLMLGPMVNEAIELGVVPIVQIAQVPKNWNTIKLMFSGVRYVRLPRINITADDRARVAEIKEELVAYWNACAEDLTPEKKLLTNYVRDNTFKNHSLETYIEYYLRIKELLRRTEPVSYMEHGCFNPGSKLGILAAKDFRIKALYSLHGIKHSDWPYELIIQEDVFQKIASWGEVNNLWLKNMGIDSDRVVATGYCGFDNYLPLKEMRRPKEIN